MGRFTVRGLSALVIAVLLCGATQMASSDDTDFARRTAEEAAQLQQLTRLARQPGHVSDKLFILWEYGGALREQALAEQVLRRVQDPQVRALAVVVRDGHQAGMDAMKPIARDLGLVLPERASPAELAAIEATRALPAEDLGLFFLRRQRAMHAWDITVFDDYGAAASNPQLKRYVEATRMPLRKHAQQVVDLANKKGIAGGLTVIAP